MNYDSWRTQTDYNEYGDDYAYMEADHRLKEIYCELSELEDELEAYEEDGNLEVWHMVREDISALEVEAEKLKQYLGITEW
jgi:hypothetical protein